jgi:outer membrane protein OmpA-like peptidoglycan-associated protein
MKFSTIAIALLISATMASSCKTTYIKKFHKEAKKEVGSAKIKLKRDTVRVVYPEVVMFDFNKDEIKPDAQTSLKRFSGLLTKYDKIDFIINGYTDNVGTDEVNNNLSQRRADNAKTLFETNGINATRMQTHGKGATNFVEPNTTEEGKAANRRVELLLFERK